MYNPHRYRNQPVQPKYPIMTIVGALLAIVGLLAFAGNLAIPGFGMNLRFDPFSPLGVGLIVIGAGIVGSKLRPHGDG
jgi:hypothetical protein